MLAFREIDKKILYRCKQLRCLERCFIFHKVAEILIFQNFFKKQKKYIFISSWLSDFLLSFLPTCLPMYLLTFQCLFYWKKEEK